MTVFQAPSFALKPDTSPRMHASVSNRMQVAYRGREMEKLVQVSSALFPILRVLGVKPENQVTLYLDEDGRKMVFGLIIDDERIIDLWHYTMDRVPPTFLKE